MFGTRSDSGARLPDTISDGSKNPGDYRGTGFHKTFFILGRVRPDPVLIGVRREKTSSCPDIVLYLIRRFV